MLNQSTSHPINIEKNPQPNDDQHFCFPKSSGLSSKNKNKCKFLFIYKNNIIIVVVE